MTTRMVPRILELEKLAYGEHHWSADSFYNELNNNLAHYYVAKDFSNEIIGYIGFWIILDEAHVTTLSVHPQERRMKVAQTLLNELVQCCYKEMVKYICNIFLGLKRL